MGTLCERVQVQHESYEAGQERHHAKYHDSPCAVLLGSHDRSLHYLDVRQSRQDVRQRNSHQNSLQSFEILRVILIARTNTLMVLRTIKYTHIFNIISSCEITKLGSYLLYFSIYQLYNCKFRVTFSSRTIPRQSVVSEMIITRRAITTVMIACRVNVGGCCPLTAKESLLNTHFLFLCDADSFKIMFICAN